MKSKELLISKEMLNSTRDELKSEITSVQLTLKSHDAKFNEIGARFDRVDHRFEEVFARFERVDRRFDEMEARFAQIDKKFEEVDARFDRLEKKFDSAIEKIMAILHRQTALIEEQNNKNNFVMDKYVSVTLRLDKYEVEIQDLQNFTKGLGNV